MAETRIVGKNARMYFGDTPLYLKAFEMELGMELNLEEATAYGVDWKEQVLIDGSISMAVNAFMDTSRPPDDLAEDWATDKAYWDAAIDSGAINEDPTVVTMMIDNTAVAGDQAYFLNARSGTFNINCPRSGLGRIRGNFNAAGQLNRGFIIAQVEQSFPTGDTYLPTSPGDIDLGVAGTIGANCALHVYKKSPAVQDFTVTIEDTATSGSGWATMQAFTLFTDRTSEYKEDRVDAGKRYQRVLVNNGGTAETLGIVVVSVNV